MKIVKYIEFIKEEMNDTPENYISIVLDKLKRRLDKLFNNDVNKEPSDVLSPEELQKRDSKDVTLFELGVELDSSEISKYSKTHDSLTMKFSDSAYTYTLIILIDIKEAIPKSEDEEFKIEDIKKCYIKFKKYDINTFEILGQLSKNIKINEIDEDFLINLKIEIDEEFGSDDEEFKIETK